MVPHADAPDASGRRPCLYQSFLGGVWGRCSSWEARRRGKLRSIHLRGSIVLRMPARLLREEGEPFLRGDQPWDLAPLARWRRMRRPEVIENPYRHAVERCPWPSGVALISAFWLVVKMLLGGQGLGFGVNPNQPPAERYTRVMAAWQVQLTPRSGADSRFCGTSFGGDVNFALSELLDSTRIDRVVSARDRKPRARTKLVRQRDLFRRVSFEMESAVSWERSSSTTDCTVSTAGGTRAGFPTPESVTLPGTGQYGPQWQGRAPSGGACTPLFRAPPDKFKSCRGY